MGFDVEWFFFIIGIVGSVVVGKSIMVCVLREYVLYWFVGCMVDLVIIDGFLFSNSELEVCGLFKKKGFLESYDCVYLVKFMVSLKFGVVMLKCFMYSYIVYDVLLDDW